MIMIMILVLGNNNNKTYIYIYIERQIDIKQNSSVETSVGGSGPLRTNGVNTNGTAAKVMSFAGLERNGFVKAPVELVGGDLGRRQ